MFFFWLHPAEAVIGLDAFKWITFFGANIWFCQPGAVVGEYEEVLLS